MAHVKINDTKYYIGEEVIVVERTSVYGEEPERIEKIIVDEFGVRLKLDSGRERYTTEIIKVIK